MTRNFRQFRWCNLGRILATQSHTAFLAAFIFPLRRLFGILCGNHCKFVAISYAALHSQTAERYKYFSRQLFLSNCVCRELSNNLWFPTASILSVTQRLTTRAVVAKALQHCLCIVWESIVPAQCSCFLKKHITLLCQNQGHYTQYGHLTLWRPLLPSASECLDVKNYKWRLNPVWHRMLYICTHSAWCNGGHCLRCKL